MNTNRPDLPDELRAMAEELEAAGFTHEDALSLALQGERLLAEQSAGERGRAERAAALIEQASHLTSTQIDDLATAWCAAQGAALIAARDAAYDASRGAAQNAARHAAQDAARHVTLVAARDAAYDAWNAAWNVVLGLLAKDSIPVEDFRTLTDPWESVMGPIEVPA